MKQKILTADQVKKRYMMGGNHRKDDLDIPGVGNIEEFVKTLEPPDRREFKHQVVEKALKDLHPQNREAIQDLKLRTQIQETTQIRVEDHCKVCTSMYVTMYNEWLVIDRSYAECSRIAAVAFEENVLPKHFSNHFKYHMSNKEFIRKAMVLRGPTADPEVLARGLAQLLAEDIIRDEDMNLKKLNTETKILKAINDFEKTRSRGRPVIDASTTNITQINQGNIPYSIDTKELLDEGLTPEGMERLKVLQSKYNSLGSGNVRSKIPDKPPVMKKEKNEAIDLIFEED
jgi:hypothetical protein